MESMRGMTKPAFIFIVAQCAVCTAFGQYNMAETIVKAQENTPVPEGKALSWDAGGDFRLRHEMWDNLPRGTIQSHNESYFRMRARLWGKVENEDFTIYGRVADEFREYVTSGPRTATWDPGSYAHTPGELILDNLYLDVRDLLWDRVDLRIGRQDLMYGSGRMIFEGTPMDGSRTFFFDAAKAIVTITENNTLDVAGFYNSPFTFGAGDPHPNGGGSALPLNSIETWSTGMAEWGSTLYFKSSEVKQFPFEVYYIYAERSSYELANTAHTEKQGRWINTVGLRLMPKLTDEFSVEFEGAAQYGQKESGATVGGHMAYLGLTYAPKQEFLGTAKPYATLATLYLSGDPDKKRGDYSVGDQEDDRSWDPLWSRYTYFLSEMYSYQSYYGLNYWSNMIYPNLEVGSKWPNKHAVFTSFGPMYAAVQDGLGGGDGALYGYFWRGRYDFPLWSKIFGKRGNIFGHVTLELLEPGDYSATDKLAYFARWEVSLAF